jgi:hypothetical protein
MTRSTRLVYETHVNNIFKVLEAAEIDFTIFMHTWVTKKNVVRNDIVEDIPVVEEEYVLLNPSVVVIDDEDEYLTGPTFNLSDYWYKSEWIRSGEYGEWFPQLVSNLVCSLESLKRLTMLVRDGESHDLVMFVRPDVRIDIPIETNWLRVVHTASTLFSNQSIIALPNFGHHNGLNDRFAIMPWKDIEKYGFRLDKMANYRKTIGFLIPEIYLKHIVSTSFDEVIEIPFKFTIIRPNGNEAS